MGPQKLAVGLKKIGRSCRFCFAGSVPFCWNCRAKKSDMGFRVPEQNGGHAKTNPQVSNDGIQLICNINDVFEE